MTDPGGAWHPVRLAREAFALTFRGSRRDLEEVTARRIQAAVVFLVLAARCIHLAQAGIDLGAGYRAYTHPRLAVGLAAACLVESALFALVVLRARRLTLSALLGDAAFGITGLMVMSAATTMTPGRAGSLNWMLPYTVTTAVGLGLLLAGDSRAVPSGARVRPGAGGRWLWPRVAARAAVAGSLAAAYLLSVYLPRRLRGDGTAQLWANDVNYLVFFGASTVVALLVRRWLTVISRRNAETVRLAAELGREAHWRALTTDVFGPVLELMDDLAVIGEQVPPSLRQEAGRLISLIDAVNPHAVNPHAVNPHAVNPHAVNPHAGSPAARGPDAGAAGEGGG